MYEQMPEQEHPFISESKQKQDYSTYNAVNIANAANYSRKTYEMLHAWEAKGIDVPMVFTLIGGAKTLHLDFESVTVLNPSPNEVLNMPGAPLFALTITNYGPGRILYSTNMPKGSLEANSQLDPDAETPMSAHNPAFKRINIVAPDAGQEARVRIQGLL